MKKKINLTNLRKSELQKEGMENLVGGESADQCRYVCSCSATCPPDVQIGPPESAHNVYQANESKRTGGLMKGMYNFFGIIPTTQ